MHFPKNSILAVEKEIMEENLLNVIIYLIKNYNLNSFRNIFDYITPIHLIMKLLQEKLPSIDLNEEDLFIKENRYKDETIFSNDYLRLKLIWYIVYIIKNKILEEKENIKDKKLKSDFIKEILTILFEEKNFEQIVFNESNDEKRNDKSYILIKEILYLFQLILDNAEALNKYHEINKEIIIQQINNLLEKRKEMQIYLKKFIIQNILKENIIDTRNNEKLNLVLFFMENVYENSEKYTEIKEIKFEENLIEILKLIDSFTFDDTEKLMKYLDKCKDNYKKLREYILLNFKKC